MFNQHADNIQPEKRASYIMYVPRLQRKNMISERIFLRDIRAIIASSHHLLTRITRGTSESLTENICPNVDINTLY